MDNSKVKEISDMLNARELPDGEYMVVDKNGEIRPTWLRKPEVLRRGKPSIVGLDLKYTIKTTD